MSDFKTLSVRECAERLLSVKDPTVAIHVRPDGDAVGSGTALAEIFSELGKKCSLICPDPIPERLLFLTDGIDITESAEGHELVSIDVASPSQLGKTYDIKVPILSIDHHRVNTPFSDNCTLPDASSAGEVLYKIARELLSMGKLSFTKRIAERIYAAVASDTGGFVYSNATAETYRIAAELVSMGIDHAEINQKLFNSKSKDQLHAEGYVALNLKTSACGKISYSTLSKEDRDRLGLPFAAFESSIDIVRSAMGSEIAFILKETDDGQFKASLRSNGADVARIAQRHSGGGHTRAAGCTVKAKDINEAEEILLSELRSALSD